MIGLFRKRALQNRLYSAKETYNFKESTKCHMLDSTESCGGHPILNDSIEITSYVIFKLSYHVLLLLQLRSSQKSAPQFTAPYDNLQLIFENSQQTSRYGVATMSRLLKITGLFCRIQSL